MNYVSYGLLCLNSDFINKVGAFCYVYLMKVDSDFLICISKGFSKIFGLGCFSFLF